MTAPIELTALGAYNFAGTVQQPFPDPPIAVNGISSPVPVGIYTNGQLLTSTLIEPGDALLGSYRYRSIQPIILQPGIEYTVLAVYASGQSNYVGSGSAPTYNSVVSFEGLSSVNSGATTTLPATPPANTEGWSDQYGAANFLFSPVGGPALSVGPMSGGFDGRTHGFRFTVDQPLGLAALGAYNFVGTVEQPFPDPPIAVNGINSPVPVGIYTNGQLLTSTLIEPGDELLGSYRYRSILPIILQPGIEYTVLAVYASGQSNYIGYGSAPTYNGFISSEGLSSANSGSTTTLPATPPANTEGWSDQYGAANFLFFPLDNTVVNTNDSGVGSLRQTIIDAFDGATITFTNTLAGQTIVLTSGQILIDKTLNIDASGIGGIIIDGNGGVSSNRIFEIAANTTNVFDSLTLSNGFAAGATSPAGNGGAIYLDGPADLTLNKCTLTGNAAGNSGGGIYCDFQAALTLNNSTFEGNSARVGGGIYNNGLLLTIYNSTLAGNSATDLGGGILHLNNQLMIYNSTLAENSSGSGGGIGNSNGDIELYNTTLAANSATSTGGGIWNVGGSFSLTLTNSIVAGNTASSDADISGSFSGSNNLTSGDPLLWPLGDYGGPTQTMPPLPGSPAIDAGLTSATNSLTDQRGMTRVLAYGSGVPVVDIGAVEYNGWLVGADLSGIDPALFLPGSIYDGTTLFPGGFDPAAAGMLEILSQSDLIAQGEANVTNNPVAYGLYTESAFQALALDRPFLTYNAASNTFTLTVGILQTPDLVSTPFTNLTGFTTIPYPGDGEIDIDFAPPNSDARFFEVYGSEPPSP